jgi:transcriptional regulator with XRE-family HTH domain
MGALGDALQRERTARGLTWAQVTREINCPDSRPVLHPISASTISGIAKGRSIAEGNIVLAVLEWLGRTPGSFVPGHPAPTTQRTRLVAATKTQRPRWNVGALHAAADAKRREQHLTWSQASDAVGSSAATLTGLAKAQHVSFPQVMEILRWLDRPAADFVTLRVLRAPTTGSE